MYARALTTNDRKRRHAAEKARTVIDPRSHTRERERRRQARVKTDSHRRTHTRTHLSELARVSRGRVMI